MKKRFEGFPKKQNSIIERLRQSVSNDDIDEFIKSHKKNKREIDTTKPRKDNVVLFVPRKKT